MRESSCPNHSGRLRSTRSLWDPGYLDESWIGRDVKAEPIALIPRLKNWVSTYYPGTKVGIKVHYPDLVSNGNWQIAVVVEIGAALGA